MSKDIEGKLVMTLVYLESGNYEAVKNEIEEVIKLYENDRLKNTTEKKDLVRLPKRVNRKSKKNNTKRNEKS